MVAVAVAVARPAAPPVTVAAKIPVASHVSGVLNSSKTRRTTKIKTTSGTVSEEVARLQHELAETNALRHREVAQTARSAAAQVGDVLWPYAAPRISAGSHRYGFFLFAQKKREKFEPVTGLPTHWDADAYLKQYQMSVLDKATSNYYILMYDGTPDDPFPPSPPH